MGNTPNAYGIPVYDDAYDLPSDLQDLADALNVFANVRYGTAAQRTALVAGQLRDGLMFSETDTGLVLVYDSTSTTWEVVGGFATAGTVTPAGTNTSWDLTLTRIGKRVWANGKVIKTSSSTFGNQEVVGTFPVGFRPQRLETFIPCVAVTPGGTWVNNIAYLLNSGTFQVNMSNTANLNVFGFNASWLTP